MFHVIGGQWDDFNAIVTSEQLLREQNCCF